MNQTWEEARYVETVSLDSSSLLIRGLRDDTQYQLRVEAANRMGEYSVHPVVYTGALGSEIVYTYLDGVVCQLLLSGNYTAAPEEGGHHHMIATSNC